MSYLEFLVGFYVIRSRARWVKMHLRIVSGRHLKSHVERAENPSMHLQDMAQALVVPRFVLCWQWGNCWNRCCSWWEWIWRPWSWSYRTNSWCNRRTKRNCGRWRHFFVLDNTSSSEGRNRRPGMLSSKIVGSPGKCPSIGSRWNLSWSICDKSSTWYCGTTGRRRIRCTHWV